MPDTTPRPLPKGLIVKAPFAEFGVGDHIGDAGRIAAVWASDARRHVSPWAGRDDPPGDEPTAPEGDAA